MCKSKVTVVIFKNSVCCVHNFWKRLALTFCTADLSVSFPNVIGRSLSGPELGILKRAVVTETYFDWVNPRKISGYSDCDPKLCLFVRSEIANLTSTLYTPVLCLLSWQRLMYQKELNFKTWSVLACCTKCYERRRLGIWCLVKEIELW
jgi:hypothetical protein